MMLKDWTLLAILALIVLSIILWFIYMVREEMEYQDWNRKNDERNKRGE